ncbi:MAG: Asp-tRNA(Asn)/Glu-tRNA(Gln) amidotransferase subunit GatC [Kiritimatiellae bacterium]|nr:Asp-tRNA(Asn)/Glu-tRNA(Gln) amidotransferase subunit GatC [Kiritimatiellia bacterium]
MKFSENADRMDVRYVAALARIELGEAEAATLQGQLDDILEFVGELKQLDLDAGGDLAAEILARDVDGGTGPMAWRDDTPADGLPVEEARALAPNLRHGQFVVPKIIE